MLAFFIFCIFFLYPQQIHLFYMNLLRKVHLQDTEPFCFINEVSLNHIVFILIFFQYVTGTLFGILFIRHKEMLTSLRLLQVTSLD